MCSQLSEPDGDGEMRPPIDRAYEANWARYWAAVDAATEKCIKAPKNAGRKRDDCQRAVQRWLESRFRKGKGYPS